MKRTLGFGLSLAAMAGLLATAAAGQSLGDYARQQRGQKPPTAASAKVYTNDNLPTSGALSEVGQPAPSSSDSAKTSAAADKAEKQAAEDKSKREAEWRTKIAEQKKNISTLQGELDVLVGENKQRLASKQGTEYLYASPGKYEGDKAKNQKEIDDKQKELADAKQKLEDMREQLRKAGLPTSWAD